MHIVELDRIEKRYRDVEALRGVDLRLQAGEVLGLFGHNGAGKTTTIKLILGLIEPSAGQVRVFGKTPGTAGARELRRHIGFLQENVSFYDQLTGEEVLNYFARLKGASRQQSRALLEQVGLDHARRRRVKGYSKGMRQRLGLAQALLGQPRLLLLDEPTVGLDPIATGDFYQHLALLKQQGCTVILCSHVLPGVEKYIDRALILGKGRVLAQGSLEQLRQQAALPLSLSLRGASGPLPAPWGEYASPGSDNVTRLQIPLEQKMACLRQLMSLPGLEDLEIQPPALEALYRHFIGEVH
ncbi:ABC transporter ATP-binding protein [Marinobacterium sp. D7]|uniref:ABC transporter ATP-binding protein n=1 Tax=Marinobacterium ramblicola TaxID=2849041 RepID=UPI001C2D2A5D|nr:ABC transporter ATP-binding protein [Marinobacterium ramblicola]MBV1790322.1 ABC transporter ATP-binding protein [Marinobacterium ramblicola]